MDHNNTCTSPGRGRCSRHRDKEDRWSKHALKTAFELMMILASELFAKRSGRDISLCARVSDDMPIYPQSRRHPCCHTPQEARAV